MLGAILVQPEVAMASDAQNNLRNRAVQVRLSRNLTQNDMARLLTLKREGSYGDWERGDTENFRPATRRRLIELLDKLEETAPPPSQFYAQKDPAKVIVSRLEALCDVLRSDDLPVNFKADELSRAMDGLSVLREIYASGVKKRQDSQS